MGAMAEWGSSSSGVLELILSGFGGLGLDGMVGSTSLSGGLAVAVPAPPCLGVGNRGIKSGDRAGGVEKEDEEDVEGMDGRIEGDAEMKEV